VYRRVVIIVGLLCMLLNGAFAVLHRTMPNVGDIIRSSSTTDTSAAPDLAQALMASMCRPADAAGGLVDPSAPRPIEENSPCLICCTPAVTAVLVPPPVRLQVPAFDRLAAQISWHARQIAIRDRISERPPVRGPPIGV